MSPLSRQGEWHRMTRMTGPKFAVMRNLNHGQMDRRRVSQGWATARSSMSERDGKDQGEDMAQSKRARGGSLGIVN